MASFFKRKAPTQQMQAAQPETQPPDPQQPAPADSRAQQADAGPSAPVALQDAAGATGQLQVDSQPLVDASKADDELAR